MTDPSFKLIPANEMEERADALRRAEAGAFCGIPASELSFWEEHAKWEVGQRDKAEHKLFVSMMSAASKQ